ncbi:hypothetical protein XENTR_v10024339 [Xenopus tropicalis]|uniref:Protein N-lysine methyltransferase METTL21A n=1 Tax=Xenopus tropicalis TaxID=8364 RepID=MT21A_XENTR|eukprot:NP_001090861.1 protein N-lysine methyltransferase METTL21A [Xenopus tropicalis]
MALVPYTDSGVQSLKRFHDSSASFKFVNHNIEIKQDWKQLGVAAVVWDAALVLCMYLESEGIHLQNSSVIELGAGTGLVGIVAALLGAQVTITDRDLAMEFLRMNVRDNIPKDSLHRVSVRALNWGKSLEEFSTYDFILGADIIYLEETFPDLLQTFLHLSSQQSVILLSSRLRYQRDHDFLEMMKLHFTIADVYYDKNTDVHIFRAQLRQRKEL